MKHRILIAGCGDLGLRVAKALLEEPDTEVWGLRRTPPVPSAPSVPPVTPVPPATSAAGSASVATATGAASVGQEQSVPGVLQWITADLSDPSTFSNLPTDITHLIFAAAPDARSEATYRATYLQGLQHIVSALASPALQRILFISSTAVYGDHGQDWVTEDTPVEPKGFNGRVLCETEAWLERLQQSTGVEILSLRLSGIYGPGRTFLLDRLRQGLASAASQPEHWVNRIHIEDATAAIVHLLRYPHPQTVYLVTDSTPLPMRTLYEALAQLAGGPVPAEGEPPKGVGSKRLSNARLIQTGFTFTWPDSRSGHAALL